MFFFSWLNDPKREAVNKHAIIWLVGLYSGLYCTTFYHNLFRIFKEEYRVHYYEHSMEFPCLPTRKPIKCNKEFLSWLVKTNGNSPRTTKGSPCSSRAHGYQGPGAWLDPETNSSFTPEKMPFWREHHLQPLHFQVRKCEFYYYIMQ